MTAPSSLATPLTTDTIGREWLEAVLQHRFPGARIASFRHGQETIGTATKLRVHLQAADGSPDLPESIIVKGRLHRDQQSHEDVYADEVLFYETINPVARINAPAVFATATDRTLGQHIVILEDLDRRGVRFCQVQHPLTVKEAAAFLDHMARYHARFWESALFATDQPLGELHHWDAIAIDARGDYGRGQLQPETYAGYCKLPRGCAVSTRFHDSEMMAAALDALIQFGAEGAGPQTLLHGDHHLGNLYFDADGTPAALDWQTISRGHWSHDMTYFLVSALDVADRRSSDLELIAYYLDRLRTHGVAFAPSQAEALNAFRLQMFGGLFYWLVNPPEWQAEVNNCAIAPRFAMAALDHDSLALIR